MNRARFIHIGFNFTGTPPIQELEQLFNKALDWMHYSEYCWILYTTTEPDVWRDRIRQLGGILPGDSFFICEFNPAFDSGYMFDWAWNWLRKDRTPKSST